MSEVSTKFTKYQLFVAITIALLQFCVVLDFMVLAPLGTFVMPELGINEKQFSIVVAAYALSAGASAIATSFFADKFDRKKLLIFFFTGFILGTLYCGLANSFTHLLLARIITGIFGGVLSSISYAIVTDLFEPSKRGRVVGLIQMSFGLSQVIGIPIAITLYNQFKDWHLIFLICVALAVVIVLLVLFFLKPVNEHLKLQDGSNVWSHFMDTIKNKRYLSAFGATVLLVTGGFMIMPFASDFATHNLKITENQLSFVYILTGGITFISSLLAGYLSDKINRLYIFTFGTFLSICIVLIYTRLGVTDLWLVILLNCILFMGISSRIVPTQALMTSIPEPKDRGVFMSINSAIQQVSGGISALISGSIVYKNANEELVNYDIVGIVVAISMICAWLMFRNLFLKMKRNPQQSN